MYKKTTPPLTFILGKRAYLGTYPSTKVEWVGFCVSVSVGRVAFIRYGCPADGTLMTLSDITFCRRDSLYSVLFDVINRSKIRETYVKLNDRKSLSGDDEFLPFVSGCLTCEEVRSTRLHFMFICFYMRIQLGESGQKRLSR